jgi:LysM repeat protein
MEERYYDSSSDDSSEENLQAEIDSNARNRKKSLPVSTLLLAAIGAALVVVVMVTVWFWEKPEGQRPAKRLKLLEHRIEQLEGRLARLNGINERVMTLESQGQKFMTAVDRLDRFETAITQRMDILAKELAGVQPAAAGKSSTAAESSSGSTAEEQKSETPAGPPAGADESTVHTVSAGETLYSISRRYGMSVDELRRANQLDEKATIYPGQTLNVR